MPLKEPSWWYGSNAPNQARLLSPIGYVFGKIAGRRLQFARPYTSMIPVICVGNFTAGGTGKTPLTPMLAERLRKLGERPGILTRGYGGSEAGPHLVDPAFDNALRTGDEALLLSRSAPTVVSHDRAAGAQFFEAMSEPPSVILMDDGLQNPGLAKMLRIAVVDARRGVGNGMVIPAGPLRAPLADQLGFVDVIIINDGPKGLEAVPEATATLKQTFREARFERPILEGHIVPLQQLEALKAKPVLAFAGIGDPGRFFNTLRLNGINIAESVPFKDHHFFDAGDAERLLQRADELGAQLVTTEKDHVRLLSYDDQRGELAARSVAFQISMALSDDDMQTLTDLIKLAIQPSDLIADRLVCAKK